MKHTSGPWFADEGYVVLTKDYDVVAEVKYDRGIDLEEVEGNCYLLAAAPDLLGACQMVLERWTFNNDQQHTHTWHDMQDCAEVIRAAMAKAEGKS